MIAETSTGIHSDKKTKAKRGFTLTEIAIVLGIIGLILGAIWAAAASAYNNLRISHANTAVLQMAQAVRALYSTSSTIGTGGSATDMTSALITANAVPSDLVNGSTLIDQWPSGVMAVEAPSTNDSFTIVLTAVPQAACINLLTVVGGSSRDPGLFTATAVDSAAPTTGDAQTTTTPITTAITPSSAATTCSHTSNKVEFGFALKT